MQLLEFSTLPDAERLDKVYREGVYVGKRYVNNNCVLLYQLDGFYVELYYTAYRKRIDRVVISGDTGLLHPYLDQVRVRLLDQGRF